MRLIRDGDIIMGSEGDTGRGWGGWGEIIYLSLDCHHQNDFCIKMGSDESHFNVSLIPTYNITRQCPQTTTVLKRKESRNGIEPRSLILLTSLTPYRWAKAAHRRCESRRRVFDDYFYTAMTQMAVRMAPINSLAAQRDYAEHVLRATITVTL